ncbi:MAG: TetR/AcrR family transcriptional regulator, cholesterol catabolism regulator [Solirubrobacteraceae bacterium]|jgi:AcrR family transcriptional regulator|nr:TetR/AcrR family transcriptional regulator, cholesterol catabolism regulator [Solirubrobacteraceae bacterium]
MAEQRKTEKTAAASVKAATRTAPRSTDGGTRKQRSRERYDERRQEVVDIAARVFADRGYHATSIDDLVRATGLQRGGLYHYMDGKKDLLIRIHERFIDPLLAEAQEIVARGEPPEATLRALAQALMHDIASYRDQVTVFLNEWRIIEHEPEWAAIRNARKAFETLVGDVLKRGQEEGVFAIKDRRIALLGFFGMFNYSYQWFKPGGRGKPEDIADQFCDIFLDGIRAD